MDLEPKDLRLIPLNTLLRHQRGVDLEQDVCKRGAEIGAVDGGVPRGLGVVDVFAFAAVELYGLDGGEVGEAGGEERVRGAGDAGAFAEVGFLVFFELEVELGYQFSICTVVLWNFCGTWYGVDRG